MRLAAFIASAAGMLVLLSASGVSAQGAAGEPRAGWYVAGGLGANWASSIMQSGWNRDPVPMYWHSSKMPKPNFV